MIGKFRAACFWLLLLAASVAGADAQTTDVVARADSLRNAREFAASVRLLDEHLRQHPTDTRADLMLAEVLYWQGDFSSAARHFSHILRTEPGNAAARRQLEEIRAVSSPWLRMRADASKDNQPIKRLDGDVDAGFFLTPLWSLGVRVAPQHAVSGDTTLNQMNARGVLKGYLVAPHVDVELSTGTASWRAAVRGVNRSGSAFIGSGRMAILVARNLKAFASVDRAQYAATVASLAAPLTTTTPALGLRVDGRWLGEAAAQRTQYPDNNAVNTAYAWLLAPIAIEKEFTLHLGYAFSYQDANQSRYTVAGRYEPYFTPDQELEHSIAGSLVTWQKSGARLQLNGSYAVYGRRTTPSVIFGPGAPGKIGPRFIAFGVQHFHPYDIHAATSLPLQKNIALTIDAERIRTSFYQNTRAGAQISIRFARRPIS